MVCNRMLTLGLVAVMAFALSASTVMAAQLMAGAAKVDITPKEPAYLAGYGINRLSEAVKEPLSARALVIKSGEKTLTVVGVDSLGVPGRIQKDIRAMVKSVPADSVMIAATHDHSAPDIFGMWGPNPTTSGVNPAYLAFFKQSIVAAIDQAAAAAKPAKLKLGSIQTKGINVNHRIPEIVDHELAAMQFVGDDGKVIATLANFPCHAEIMQSKLLSGDFPYYYYAKIEKDQGGVAIFINGALGGMITADIPGGIYSLEGKDNSAWAQRIGEAMADATEQALAGASTIENADLDYKFVDLALPFRNERAQAAARSGAMPNPLADGKLVTKVAAVALGPAQIVTIPGEALPNLGFHLKRVMTGSPKFLFGLTMDELGYIMSGDDWGMEIYKYESNTGAGPETGPLLMATLLPLIAEVKPAAAEAPAAATTAPVMSATVAQWFAGLPGRFNAEKAAGLTAVYGFKLSGDGGGDWTISVADQKCSVKQGAADKADVIISVAASDWMDAVSGKADAAALYMTGKLSVDGDLSLAQRFVDLFGAR
jgi:putative sterol carrier protein